MKEEPNSPWKKPLKGSRLILAWSCIVAFILFLIIFSLGAISSSSPKGSSLFFVALVSSVIIAGLAVAIVWFVRWLCCWRNFRRFLFVVVCLATLFGLLWAEENWRGKRAWTKFKKEWEAKGERFDLASFVPPAVPDDQNLAMIPLFRPLFDFTPTDTGVEWHDTNGLAIVQSLQIDTILKGSTNQAPGLGNLERGRSIALEAWRSFYRDNTNYPQPKTPGPAAADVLVAIEKYESELSQVQEAAKTRTLSRFPIRYDFDPPGSILLPHLAALKSLCLLYTLRSVARMELGQSEEALVDLQTGFRLSDSVRDEPFLIDHLVRISMLSIELQGVNEGLRRRVWNDSQIASLEKYLASVDVLAEHEKNLRGERALNLGGLDYYRRKGTAAGPSAEMFVDVEGGSGERPGFLDGLNLMPSGWYYHNMTTIARMHQEFTLTVVNAKEHRAYPDTSTNLIDVCSNLRTTPYNIFAKMLMPAFSKAGLRASRAQTYVDLARIGCALERYRLGNGHLPQSLDLLVPQFIDRIPNDIIDGRPVRYRPDADGSYILYSVGWNQIDDGGTMISPRQDGTIDKSKEDWVWKMPAK